MCVSTLRGLRKSSLATWALVIPVATRPNTSSSRGVSPAGCLPGAERDDCPVAEGSSAERAYSIASSSPIVRPPASAPPPTLLPPGANESSRGTVRAMHPLGDCAGTLPLLAALQPPRRGLPPARLLLQLQRGTPAPQDAPRRSPSRLVLCTALGSPRT